MSLRAATSPDVRSRHPVAVESALVVAVFLGLYLWRRALVAAQPQSLALAPSDDLLVAGLVSGGFVVVGFAFEAGLQGW